MADWRAPHLWIYVIILSLSTASATNLELYFNIDEEVQIGSVVGNQTLAQAADFSTRFGGNIPSNLRYDLLEPKESPYFSVHPVTGTITTTQRLDREAICPDLSKYEACSQMVDIAVSPMEYFTMIKVIITIQDINDNSPMFPKRVHDIMIPEDAAVNTTLFLPMASDADSVYGVDFYELETYTRAFTIETRQGVFGEDLVLVLVEPLDRERQGSYTLKLVARDTGHPSRSGMMLLNITVSDENDNKPSFQQSLYSVRVPESALPGIMLTRVKATDKDSGANGLVKYAISPRTTNKIKNIFQMNENTGEIVLKQQLDYEADKNFLIPIIAYDSAPLPHTSQAIVNISISDENDNAPNISIATVTSKAQVIENSPLGTFVARVRVTDSDSDSNGLVTCILSSPYFKLQESYQNEFSLVVNAPLDRELDSSQNVTIMCTDAGSPPKVTTVSLNINVVDVNDEKPTFDRLVYYTLPIPENNEPGMPITQVKAMDKDSDTNAEIEYHLGNEADASYFSVHKMTGLITAKTKLDREKQKEYTFSVLATDKGVEPLTATAAVYIRIADLNDNAPSFNVTHYRMSIAENMPKYAFVGKVSAVDADEGINGEVWYRLVNASTGPFIIAHDTGIISTRAPLDREKIGGSQYQITVVATDYGSPSLSSDIKITIDVLDENDHAPIITSVENQTIECSYQTPINTTIGHVVAYDPDYEENGRLGYFIQSGNQYKLFSIDKKTGEIRVAANLDISLIGHHRLEIGVHDNGMPPLTIFTNVFVQVTKSEYLPAGMFSADRPVESNTPKTYNVNLIVVVVLSSMSGVLSLILIVAIIRIKRQTKENHSYNCRTEAQKLFATHGGSSRSDDRPSCGSSWVGTDRSSLFSRDSMICSQERNDQAIPMNKSFLTTFASNNNHPVVSALQNYDKNNLDKEQQVSTAQNYNNYNTQYETSKHDADEDSGNCEDGCSVHNSTPMISSLPHNSTSNVATIPNKEAFQYRFLAGREDEVDSKVPSSISSGNNSITTDSSHHSSPVIVKQNSTDNQNQRSDIVNQIRIQNLSKPVQIGPGWAPKLQRPPLTRDTALVGDTSSSDYPQSYNTSSMSDQTINGERLCEKIDEMFFSEIV